MEYNITDIINTMLGVDENNQPLSAPDGVIDRSRIAEILGMITQEGRPFKSDEPAAITRAIGALLERALVEQDSKEFLNALLALSMMPTLIVRAVQEICSTVCPEEVFMIAFDQCQIDRLRRDLQSTPYFQMADGRMVCDVHAHHLFAAPFIIDEAVKHDFVRRHITPAHYAAHEAQVAESSESESHDDSEFEILDDSGVTDEAPLETPKSRKVRLSDLGRLSADPLEGFDEFHDYFRAHDHKLWEAGLDLDDLPQFGEEADPDA